MIKDYLLIGWIAALIASGIFSTYSQYRANRLDTQRKTRIAELSQLPEYDRYKDFGKVLREKETMRLDDLRDKAVNNMLGGIFLGILSGWTATMLYGCGARTKRKSLPGHQTESHLTENNLCSLYLHLKGSDEAPYDNFQAMLAKKIKPRGKYSTNYLVKSFGNTPEKIILGVYEQLRNCSDCNDSYFDFISESNDITAMMRNSGIIEDNKKKSIDNTVNFLNLKYEKK